MPDLGQYEVSFVHAGDSNYKREYKVFSTNSDSVYRQDYASELFFKSHPDPAGNLCIDLLLTFAYLRVRYPEIGFVRVVEKCEQLPILTL